MQKPTMFYGAPPHIFEKARELRKTTTPAEKHLWQHLRKRKLNGYKFRRQHPMAKFIADFYCHSAKLVVEVDGGVHETKERKQYDVLRTEQLNDYGITVIRFTNNEVQNKTNQVLADIKPYLEK